MKNITYIITYIVLLLFFPFKILATTQLVESDDDKIFNILSKMSSFYQSCKNFHLEFEYDPDVEGDDQYYGILIMEGDNKYVLKLNKEPKNKIKNTKDKKQILKKK